MKFQEKMIASSTAVKRDGIKQFSNFVKIIVCMEFFILMGSADALPVVDPSDLTTNGGQIVETKVHIPKPSDRKTREVEPDEDDYVEFEFKEGTSEKEKLATEAGAHVAIAYLSGYKIEGLEEYGNVSEIFQNLTKLMGTFLLDDSDSIILTVDDAKQLIEPLDWDMSLAKPDGNNLWNYEFTFKLRGSRNYNLAENKILKRLRKLINRIFDWKYREVHNSNQKSLTKLSRRKIHSVDVLTQESLLENNDALLLERRLRLKAFSFKDKPKNYIETIESLDTAIDTSTKCIFVEPKILNRYKPFQTGHNYLINQPLLIRKEGYKLIKDLYIETWPIMSGGISPYELFNANPFINFFLFLNGSHDYVPDSFLETIQMIGRALELEYVVGNLQSIPATDAKKIGKFLYRFDPVETPIVTRIRHILNAMLKMIASIENPNGSLP